MPISPRTKNVCFVGCVSNIKPNNFFVDECGCQEVKLRTSLTKGLPKKYCSTYCNMLIHDMPINITINIEFFGLSVLADNS